MNLKSDITIIRFFYLTEGFAFFTGEISPVAVTDKKANVRLEELVISQRPRIKKWLKRQVPHLTELATLNCAKQAVGSKAMN